MSDVILNVTGTGGWQTLGPTEGFPHTTYTIMLQPRNAVNAYYRFAEQTNYVTIKNGGSVSITGVYHPGVLQVLIAVGEILEVHLSTHIASLG